MEKIASEADQKLLTRICEGWSQLGENGELEEAAQTARDKLIEHLVNEIPSTARSVWDVESV
jgi:hypothetical protein